MIQLTGHSRPRRACLSVLILLTWLTGCESVPPAAPAVPAPLETPDATDPAIAILLAEAEIAMSENRLTTPLDSNAYYLYLRVLSIDPDNEEANRGLAAIVDRYLTWAITHVHKGNYHRARDYLNKARSVDETDPNIAAVQNLLDDAMHRRHEVVLLDRQAVDSRTPEVSRQLQEIGAGLTGRQARVVIEAPSDAAGRWIYQQLNRGAPERVRARFELASDIRIRILYR